ncbi:MAG: serine hydrolase domain-containing protein [Bacteroidales bacterium]
MKSIPQLLTITLFIMTVIACNPSPRQASSATEGFYPDSLKAAVTVMQAYIDRGEFAGIAVEVLKENGIVQQEYLGYADMENEVPIQENTIYRIFSMSKPVTAVALMTLYDEGKFKLDDRLSEYIPYFAKTLVYTPSGGSFSLEIQADPITIRNLLTHTAGFTYGWEPGSYVDSLYNVTGVAMWNAPLEEKMELLSTLPLKYQPGTRWEYGLSIDVAGYLVEVLSGMPLDKYMQAKIFGPLKMTDTGFDVPEGKHERLSVVYVRDGEGKLMRSGGSIPGADFIEVFKSPAVLFSGGGGLVSTMGDYERFCRMLLNGGILDGERVLQESTVQMIMSNQLPGGVTYGDGLGYGLGGFVNPQTGAYGWSGAASTSFTLYPKDHMAIMAYAQLMPSDYSYANDYRDLVRRAMIR